VEEPLAQFVEDVALFWEAQGLPRIAGRILGWLLVCDPPHRSSTQLAEELGASKGSVSAMTRLLRASGTIEVVPLPGERATYFQLTPAGLERKFEARIKAMIEFRVLADRGLELLADTPETQQERLREVAALYAFLERELPLLLERWREERGHE
jgi:DNA-binding transcriptional regulator GbsR (MarR family)